MASPYLSLLEALRSYCNLPAFPDPLPSNQLDLELTDGPTVTIDFKEEAQSIEFFSEVGIYEPKDELDILKKIAQANFLWAATSGGTLSARPEIRTVYFAYQTPISTLEGNEFVNLVEKFVEVTQQWQLILKKSAEVSEAAANNTESQSAPFGETA